MRSIMDISAMANWSDLPPELLDLIAKSFEISSDTRGFRSVCSSWRLAVPRPLSVQLGMLPMRFPQGSDHQNCKFRLAKHTFFYLSDLSASAGWLIKTEEHKPGTFHLFNPFARTPIKINPPRSNIKLDVSNAKIQELGYEYVLQTTCDARHDLCNMEHEKVAFESVSSSSNLYYRYVILSTHKTGKLLLYRSWSINDSGAGEWAFLDDLSLGYDDRSIFVNDWSLHYADVVEYQGVFYAVTNSGRTVAIKLNSNADDQGAEVEANELSSCVTVRLLTKSMIGGDKKFLVKSEGDLLLVDLYTCPAPGMVKVHAVEIFKLDEEQRWVLLKGVGDRALFLSDHSSFSAVGLPGCKGNSVYFHLKNWDYYKEEEEQEQEQGRDHIKKKGSEDDPNMWQQRNEIGVFDYDKGIVGSLPEYLQHSVVFSWPPPDWATLST